MWKEKNTRPYYHCRILLARLWPPSPLHTPCTALQYPLLIPVSLSRAQLERAIYKIKRGTDVSQLDDGNMISTERVIKEVQTPVMTTIPTDDVFFSKTEEGKPDVEFLKDHFSREGRIKEEHALYIIDKATQLLRAEPNVLTVDAPVIVCGDIHGQYYDLMKLFVVGGHPSFTRYLFLGDYVSGGYFSIECLLYLWTLKIWSPNSFFLLRGHQERRRSNPNYSFKIECEHKYSERVYEACLGSFCALPLVAIIAKRYFCVHGGISPELHTIDDIRKLNRFCESPTSGLMHDILWSDPIEGFGEERIAESFVPRNRHGGHSYFYTFKAVCDFLERNRLVSIIRAHQIQEDGYRMYRKRHNHPSVMTIYSAPNCLDTYINRAAVLKCYGKVNTVRHWSLPFICEKILDILAAMLCIYFLELDENIEDSTLNVVPVDRDKTERLEMLQNKILLVRCISYMFSILREESGHESELKPFSRLSGMQYGVLLHRAGDIKNRIRWFNQACTSDKDHERLFTIKEQLTSVFVSLPNPKGSASEKAASASGTVGATSMTPLRSTKEGMESEAEKLNQHGSPSDTSQYQTEPRTNRATPEIQDSEKQLREKERHLQIREVEVQGVEEVLRMKERDLQIREAEVQKMLDAVNEGREAMDLQEDDLRQRWAAMREWEENLCLVEAALTHPMTIVRQPNSAARESDLLSLSSFSTTRNSIRGNVDHFPKSSGARLKQDSRYHNSDLDSLASTTTGRSGSSKLSNIDFFSNKSHTRLKEDSEYYGNE